VKSDTLIADSHSRQCIQQLYIIMLSESASESEEYYLKWWNWNYELHNTCDSACSQSAIYISESEHKEWSAHHYI